jgi:hypothetical protein
MSEEDTILPSVQTTMALDAKVYAYFKNKNWCIYCGSARHRKYFQPFCTDCRQYHVSVKYPKISRLLLLRDPDISIWYDDISCKIRSEFAGDPNYYHFCWPKLRVMTTCHYNYLKNRI